MAEIAVRIGPLQGYQMPFGALQHQQDEGDRYYKATGTPTKCNNTCAHVFMI